MIVPPTLQMINDLLSSMAYIGQAQGPDVGYAVGVASPYFKPFLALPGALLDQSGNPMTFDGDVPFELASISKVFTSALLTRLALRDPELWTKSITSCVPDGLPSLPAAFDPITLMDLANYTSGLPEDDADTSIDVPTPLPSPFTELALYQYLHDGNVPVSGPGTTYTYSNLAPSLLAISLPTAVQSELSFGGLLAREITGPLGMTRPVPSTASTSSRWRWRAARRRPAAGISFRRSTAAAGWCRLRMTC